MCKGGGGTGDENSPDDSSNGSEEGAAGSQRQQWFKYDDESVKLIDDIESQMLSTQKAYILFYQKVIQGDPEEKN